MCHGVFYRISSFPELAKTMIFTLVQAILEASTFTWSLFDTGSYGQILKLLKLLVTDLQSNSRITDKTHILYYFFLVFFYLSRSVWQWATHEKIYVQNFHDVKSKL